MPSMAPQATLLPGLLKDWMDRNGYTLEAVVKMVGLSERNGATQVSRWRSGRMFPNKTNEHKLAQTMGVPIEDFYPPGTFRSGSSNDFNGLHETVEGLVSRFDVAEEDLLDRITRNTRRLGAIESGIDEIRELLVALIGSEALAESLPEAVARRRDDLVRALETSQHRAAGTQPETQSE